MKVTWNGPRVREWMVSILGLAVIIQQVWFESTPDIAIVLIGAGLAGAGPAGAVNKKLNDAGKVE